MEFGWHYCRDGKQIGPISGVALRVLVDGGGLRAEDIVWKEGMAGWKKAGTIKGLFPKSDMSSAQGTDDYSDEFFVQAEKPADLLGALQVEKATIQSASLPQAYVDFGQALYERVDHSLPDSVPDELAPIIKQVDSLLSVLARQTAPFLSSDPSRPASQLATGPAMAKATEKEVRKKYAQLGKRAYDRGDHPASCKDEVLNIRAFTSRDVAITQQIAALKQKAAAKAARRPGDDIVTKGLQLLEDLAYRVLDLGRALLFSAPVVCLLAVLVPPIGLFLIWRHPTWGKFSKMRWTTISVVCFLSLLMIETTIHVAGTGLGIVTDGVRVAGSSIFDYAAANGIVPAEKKPKWLGGPANEWVEEPLVVQTDVGTPPSVSTPAPSLIPSAPKAAPPQAVTLDAFRGEWKATLSDEFGVRMPDSELAQQDRRLLIDGPAFSMERTKDNQRGSYQGRFRFSPNTKAFDWKGTGPNGAAMEWVGIYDLAGDTLKLCYRQKRGTDAPQRPTVFRSDDEKPAALNYEYRRISQQIRRVSPPPPAASTAASSPTASGSLGRGAQLGNRFYKIVMEKSSWRDAKEKCELLGGRLAVIDTADKEQFLKQLAAQSGITFDQMDGLWIGATDERKEGDWKWVDGTSVNYADWLKNQPNNKNNAEHYAMLWVSGGGWSDQPNDSTQHTTYFVCEWDK